ncbi:MAG TPA: hypothetical protein VFX67_00470 [Burkholderiales bacterium]|nr:hypothetical protein [Burkholderiales bacterium]
MGQYLGGPWTVVAPAAGFGIGLLADMRLMKGMHGRSDAQHRPNEPQAANGDAAAQTSACCGLAAKAAGLPSWLANLLGEKGKGEMTLAQIRKTYQADSGEPPRRA